MIEFKCRHYHREDGTPYVKDVEIMEYAEMLLQDYKPKLLKEAGKINAEHFLESYLGAELDYQDIYYDGDDAIAGATVFNDEQVKVFDHENMCTRIIPVPGGTILIDNSTLEVGKEGFALFTELHEGGHFCIHPCVYRRASTQLSFFDTDDTGNHIVKCKRSAFDNKGELRTQEDFREHQANTFAAAIAMPKPTFIPTVKKLIRDVGIGEESGIIVAPREPGLEFSVGMFDLTRRINQIFGASRTAAEIHMRKLELIIPEEKYVKDYHKVIVAL